MKLTTVVYKEENQYKVRVFGSSIVADKFINQNSLPNDKNLKLVDNTQTLLPIFKVDYWKNGWIHFCYCTKNELQLKLKLAQTKALIKKGVRHIQIKVEGLEEI